MEAEDFDLTGSGIVRYMVLLKKGLLLIEACSTAEVFILARRRKAGICAVFAGYKEAEAFVEQASSPDTHARLSSSGSGLPKVTRHGEGRDPLS